MERISSMTFIELIWQTMFYLLLSFYFYFLFHYLCDMFQKLSMIHCKLKINSTLYKIDFEKDRVFSDFHYSFVEFKVFRKCSIFCIIEIRFDFLGKSFSRKWRFNTDCERCSKINSYFVKKIIVSIMIYFLLLF